MYDCERCGSDENVSHFLHYDTNDREYLCWSCREPIVKNRIHGNDCDDESSGGADELNGQTGLADWS